jgi:hypothetical protein
MTSSATVGTAPASPLNAIEDNTAGMLQHDLGVAGMGVDAAIANASRHIDGTIADYRADPAVWARCYAEPSGECG